MKTLLQINVVCNILSTGKIAEDIGKSAINDVWNSYIAYARGYKESESKTIKIGNKFNLLEHVLETRLFDNHALASRLSTKKFIKQIDEIKPDIIHLHNLHGYYINYKMLFNYLSKLDIPIVWTLHDCWSFTGHCAHFDFIGCDKWKTGCYACPQKKGYPKSLLLDRSRKNYIEKKQLFNSVHNLTLVPVSHWLEDLVKESFLCEHKIKTIYNGIDIKRFIPSNNTDEVRKKYKLENNFVVLGVASTWGDRKGLKDYIKLASIIDDNTKIVLVGLNDEQLKSLPNNVIGIKRTYSIEELVDLYSVADLFLNCTYEDNFPTVNLEALACGTPILTYKTGGSVESVSAETGFIVEQGDIDSILKIMNEVKEKGKAYYTDTCRKRAEQCFNKDDRFQEYIDLYNKQLDK